MTNIVNKEHLIQFKQRSSPCVNIKQTTFYNKELILDYTKSSKQIGFIIYGKATIIKTDINGNTLIVRELKENDIFSNLFFENSEDEVFIISNIITEVSFIDYHSIIKNCKINCPFHNNLVLTLFNLLIEDNRQQNEKITLLSKRNVREKIEFFLKKRMNKERIFKVTTSYKAIAEYIAVDRSNFMRELKKMEKEGLIKKDGKIIEIKK